MKSFKTVLFLLLSTALGCGQQLVEYPLDAVPTVTVTDPGDMDVGVAPNTRVTAAFSEAMDPTTLTATTFTLAQAGAPIPATVTYAGTTATLVPSGTLATGAPFTATITTGAQDYLGHPLAADYVWTFTTRDAPDTTPPTVTLTNPEDLATAVDLDAKVDAVFSEAMDPATLTTATFTVAQGAAPVAGAVTYSGLTATFIPTTAFAPHAAFTATLTTGAKDLAGNALAAAHVWSFTTRSDAPPTVTVTDPSDMAVAVPASATIHAAFSEAMDPATITGATFTLAQGATTIPGTVTYADLTATFTPTSALASDAVLTATITTGAKDPSGHALAAPYTWTFTTRSDAPPTVTFTDPGDMAVAVPASATIHAAFSEAMDPATITAATFTLAQGATAIPGTVTYAGLTATFTPTSALAPSDVFTATITTGAKDPSGHALTAPYTWTFTTSALPDVTPPVVTFTSPADQETGVDPTTPVQVAFDEAMDCATIDATTFTLAHGGVPVLGAVACAGATATFTPTSALAGDPTYTATITTGAKSVSGIALATSYVWTFETGPHAGQAPIDLGAASTYAILAFNTVTNVNNPGTIVTGDLGISPGAALVGFPPGQVTGSIHAGDAVAAAAKAALLAAYNDAAGRLGAAVLPGDLSGLTFAPGLYKNSTSVMLSTGNLTLDAQGDANAVFIFQMGATLTTSAGTQVILAGGAQATNIYWAVGTSATLGTNSSFTGTILAASAITMQTGASITGRLLAQGAAVALDTNAITVPGP